LKLQIAKVQLQDESDRYAAEEDWDWDVDQGEALSPDLLRAWRAAVISLVVCPLILNIYSTWLLWKNGLFIDPVDGTNWRVPIALAINTGIFFLLATFFVGELFGLGWPISLPRLADPSEW